MSILSVRSIIAGSLIGTSIFFLIRRSSRLYPKIFPNRRHIFTRRKAIAFGSSTTQYGWRF